MCAQELCEALNDAKNEREQVEFIALSLPRMETKFDSAKQHGPDVTFACALRTKWLIMNYVDWPSLCATPLRTPSGPCL